MHAPPPPSADDVTITEQIKINPDSKVHGANTGPTGPRWAPCGPREPYYLGNRLRTSPMLCIIDPVIAWSLWKWKVRAFFLHRATKSNEGIYMMAAILLQSCHSIKSTRKNCIPEIDNKNKQNTLILCHNTILLLRLRFVATILARSTPWCCCDSYRISARRLSWHLPLSCIIVVRDRYCVLPLKTKWWRIIVHTHDEIMVFKGALWKFPQNFEPIHHKICILRRVSKNYENYLN